MESFLLAINAVIPFLVYITFGYFVRAVGMVDEEFMNRLNQMVFHAFFPILMFVNIYSQGDTLAVNVPLTAVSVVCILILTALLFLIVPSLVKDNARRGVIIMDISRSNFILYGIPLAQSVFGDEGKEMAAMMVAVIIPLFNVLSVIVLEYYRGGRVSAGKLLKEVFTNPLILGVIAGLLAVLAGLRLPECLETPLTKFSDMTTPLALFVLGGTLRFSSMRDNMKCLVSCLAVKLVFIPMVILALALALGFSPLERFVLLTVFATPVAVSSYPMAKNMGGDGALAGEMVVLSTAVSVVTIFLWVFFLSRAGLV